jgi:hypothetical protein
MPRTACRRAGHTHLWWRLTGASAPAPCPDRTPTSREPRS